MAAVNWELPAVTKPAVIAGALLPTSGAALPSAKIGVRTPPRAAPPSGISTVIVPLAGPAPQNVRMLPGGPRIHTLVWDSVAGSSGYKVFRNNTATGGTWMLANGTPLPGPIFPDTNILQPGAKYRVTALYADGRQGSTDFLYSNPPQLQVPTGFAAQQVAPGQVRLSWQPVTFVTGYRVIGEGQPADGALVTATELVLSGLADGVHSWKLSADYLGAYATAGLPTASITLKPAATPCTPAETKPGPAPANLSIPPGPVGGAQIDWDFMPGAVAYVIVRQEALMSTANAALSTTYPAYPIGVAGAPTVAGTSCSTPGAFKKIGPYPFGTRQWIRFKDISGGITPGATYRYAVTAFGPAGESGTTSGYWTALPPNPPSISVTRVSPANVKLSWTSVRDASFYMLWGAGIPDSGPLRVNPTSCFYTSAEMAILNKFSNSAVVIPPPPCSVMVQVPAGTHSWTLAAFFEPGPISSDSRAFTKVTVAVP
ncbi:MAG: hypothetical protein M3068_07655 [Gemmatimonadota bacterium]|nr:hypothetical protein [Gemmatimonadota bacterium]